MEMCRCCGGPVEATALGETEKGELGEAALPWVNDGAHGPSAAGPIWVEVNVLACCNAAYERAERNAAAEVGLLDLLHAIASAPTLAAWLAAYDVDRDLLRIEIEAIASGDLAAMPSQGGSPRTSPAMRDTLMHARTGAERRLAVSLGIGDVLTAILEHDLGPASLLLAEHVSRERLRRRGGGRAWRADAAFGLGALDAGEPTCARAARLAANDGHAFEPIVTTSRQASAGRAWEAGPDDFERTARQRFDDTHLGEAPLEGIDEFGPAPPPASAAGGDFYRPGKHELGDAWRPLSSLPPAGAGPVMERSSYRPSGVDSRTLGMIGDMQSGLDPVSSSDVRELTLQVGAWRSQLMARLDEQEMHLDEILGQLARQPRFPALGAIATTAPSARAASATAPARDGRTCAAARSGSRGVYLSRGAIRASMQRTASRRRQIRKQLAQTQAAAAAQARQAQAARAIEDGRRAREAGQGANSQTSGQAMRMAVAPREDATYSKAGVERRRPADDDDDTDDTDNGQRAKRFYLSMDDDIVEAPSIGPRTAERLREHGIVKVRDLLAVKAQALSARVGVRHITAERIMGWQHQARLVCTIPWLRGTHAQILVGSGYYAPHSIVTANRDALCTSILRFATTREGQSVLRSAPPPSLGKIMRWVEQAAMAELERAELDRAA